MSRIVRYFNSLAGWIAIFLLCGMLMAVGVSLFIVSGKHAAEFRQMQNDRIMASATDMVSRLQREPDRTMQVLKDDQFIGANLLRVSYKSQQSDDPLNLVLNQRIAPAHANLAHVKPEVCIASSPFWQRPRIAGIGNLATPDCWVLTVKRATGPLSIALILPAIPSPPNTFFQPLFLGLIIISCMILALITARLATAPLRHVEAASQAFAASIDAAPVPEGGPLEVREALATFNLMQERVRKGLRDRAKLLGAISHDLQTPLTRLRLRLEKVEDPALRERLLADLSATLDMVKRGLDLARSGESAEEWSVVDLDSLLSSMIDDAAEAGHDIRFTEACGCHLQVRLDALTRCLGNLIDNAIKYGGAVDVSCQQQACGLVIYIRDDGPGMPADLMERAFEPFVRGDVGRKAGEGTGIGLAIARAQAQANNAQLTLSNRKTGGLEAMLKFPLSSIR